MNPLQICNMGLVCCSEMEEKRGPGRGRSKERRERVNFLLSSFSLPDVGVIPAGDIQQNRDVGVIPAARG